MAGIARSRAIIRFALPIMETYQNHLKFRIKSLFLDMGLTKKASLNALTVMIEYFSRIVVALIITPLIIQGLGNYLFGIWQVLNRIVGYMSPTNGRPTTALKFSLANHQTSIDYDYKRRLFGSAVAVWFIFLPLLLILGGALVWFVPFWLKVPEVHFWQVRMTTVLLVGNLALIDLAGLPRSILEGENLGYKLLGLSALMIFIGGVFTWLSLHLNTGIVGIAGAAMATVLFSGVFILLASRNHISWLGIVRPSWQDIRQLLGLSGWFLSWNFVSTLMLESDVAILGFLGSVSIVPTYTLSKYSIETVMNALALIVIGIIPGLGGLFGSGDITRVCKIRNQIMALTWLMTTVTCCIVILWNRAFISLWIGPQYYAGHFPMLLIVLSYMQIVFIRNDYNIMDVALMVRPKVFIGSLSVIILIASSILLVGHFQLGIIGLCCSLIISRSVSTISYPVLIGKRLRISFLSQLKGTLRPALVTIILFIIVSVLQTIIYAQDWFGITQWIGLILSIGLSLLLLVVTTFFLGLRQDQRKEILERFQLIIVR